MCEMAGITKVVECARDAFEKLVPAQRPLPASNVTKGGLPA